MKAILNYFSLVLLLLPALVRAQCPTYTNNLIINTGYDYVSGGAFGVSMYDPNWIFVSDGDAPTSEPEPGNTISMATPYANSQFISHYPSSINSINGTYTMEYKFCLASLSNFTLNLGIKVDDGCDVFLNGNYIGSAGGTGGTTLTTTSSSFFTLGTNTLRVDLLNIGSVAMGIDIGGSLTSNANSIISPLCCNSGVFIHGTKFNDLNADGFRSGIEPFVPNWPIYLTNGITSYSTITDPNGYYYFSNMPAGTYTLSEPTATNITVTTPTTGGVFTFTTGPNSVVGGDQFGNYFSCCSFNGTVYVNGTPYSVSSPTTITVCKETMNLAIVNNCGYPSSLVNSFLWDMGDGNSYNGASVTHGYGSTGNYVVHLKNTSGTCTNTASSFTLNVISCTGSACDKCISSFAPPPGDYIISLWVREDRTATPRTYTGTAVQVSFNGDPTIYGPFFPDITKNVIIDGWQRIEEKFTVPPGATDIKIKLLNTNSSIAAYFDDVRVHPYNGNMKSYVYDPITLRLVAELDENNYATLYEYNEEGQLIRVKKETEKGIMTIKETRSSNKK